jgi:hypothetical protein
MRKNLSLLLVVAGFVLSTLDTNAQDSSSVIRPVSPAPIRSVPDGGSTLGLLGVACLGLGWVARKIKSL